MATPPACTVTPSRSWTSSSVRALACFCASLSPPVIPATISPVLPSSLTRAGAAAGGALHAEVTAPTCGDCASRSAMSVPTARAAGARTPSSSVTLMISSMSP